MGKVYWSPFAAYGLLVRPERKIYDSGVLVDTIPEIEASFAVHGPELEYELPDGSRDRAAQISGHFFDLDAQSELNGWTPEEKDLVEKRLDFACQRFPGQIRLHTKPAAPLPWPTYDTTHHLQIAKIAESTGTVANAIAYEKENKQRVGLIEQLEKALATQQASPMPEPDEAEDLVPAA